MKKKLNLEPGQKYRGYGILNEYGEFEFIPEETGSRLGQVKKLTSGDGYDVSTTKKYVIMHIKVKKSKTSLEMMRNLLRITDKLIEIVRTYEF